MRGGEDVMPHRSPHTVEWNQRRPIHLMSSQGTKYLLYTHKQPLKTHKNAVFSGVVPFPASSGNVSLPRESGK